VSSNRAPASNQEMARTQQNLVRRKRLQSNSICLKLRVIRPCRNPPCFRPSLSRDGAAKTGRKFWLAENRDAKRLFFHLSFA
jgi:hypothetical protein